MKLSLLALLAALSLPAIANETTYTYMESAAPHDQHSAFSGQDYLSSGHHDGKTAYSDLKSAAPHDQHSAFSGDESSMREREGRYSYMNSPAPISSDHNDRAKMKTNTVMSKDEVSDTASVNQAATRRDYNKDNSMKKASRCKTHMGQWLRPQDEGFINCMNMPDTEKK